MLYVSSDRNPNVHTEITYFTYPGGEIGLGPIPPDEVSTITALLYSAADREALALLRDALDRRGYKHLRLDMPYIPYARQDRAIVGLKANESLSVKVFARFINSLGFRTVTVADPHSDVSPALINNCFVIHRNEFMPHVFNALGRLQYTRADMVLVAPDAGALKATFGIAREYGIETVLTAEKKRDMSTGQITGTSIHNAAAADGKHIIITDDICDGGRTFIEIANAFSDAHVEPASLTLYVTHGIFSKGVKCLLEHFDNIFSPYPFLTTATLPDGSGWDQLVLHSGVHTVDNEWASRAPVNHTPALTIITKK